MLDPTFRLKACRIFALGRCNKGTECKYSHDAADVSAAKADRPIATDVRPNTKKQRPCPRFLKGKCRLGELCWFLHDRNGGEGGIFEKVEGETQDKGEDEEAEAKVHDEVKGEKDAEIEGASEGLIKGDKGAAGEAGGLEYSRNLGDEKLTAMRDHSGVTEARLALGGGSRDPFEEIYLRARARARARV